MSKPRKEEKITRYSKEKRINKLTDRDIKALNNIYDFRCLSFDQIYELTYKFNDKTGEINNNVYCRRKLNEFISLNLIKEINIYDKNVPLMYQLTMEGINIIRKRLNWPDNIYDEKLKLISKGYLIESELNVKERFMNHQYNLNKFVFKLMEVYKNNPYKYEDEKHIQSFLGIRPDGVFTTGNITYFLEMDMGTENLKKLQEKWNHYRVFLNSNEFINNERKIVVLFIVDGIVRINQRISLIKNSINTNFMDCFNYGIEMYINTPDLLINAIQNRILKEFNNEYIKINKSIKNLLQQDIKIINDISIIKKHFENHEFSFLARIDLNDKKIDLLFENYDNESIKSIYNVMFFDKITNNYRNHNNSKLIGVLICENEEIAYRNFLIFDLMDIKFTTFDRLNKFKINEAIFTLDKDGNLYNFNDILISKPKFEKIIKI